MLPKEGAPSLASEPVSARERERESERDLICSRTWPAGTVGGGGELAISHNRQRMLHRAEDSWVKR